MCCPRNIIYIHGVYGIVHIYYFCFTHFPTTVQRLECVLVIPSAFCYAFVQSGDAALKFTLTSAHIFIRTNGLFFHCSFSRLRIMLANC